MIVTEVHITETEIYPLFSITLLRCQNIEEEPLQSIC